MHIKLGSQEVDNFAPLDNFAEHILFLYFTV